MLTSGVGVVEVARIPHGRDSLSEPGAACYVGSFLLSYYSSLPKDKHDLRRKDITTNRVCL